MYKWFVVLYFCDIHQRENPSVQSILENRSNLVFRNSNDTELWSFSPAVTFLPLTISPMTVAKNHPTQLPLNLDYFTFTLRNFEEISWRKLDGKMSVLIAAICWSLAQLTALPSVLIAVFPFSAQAFVSPLPPTFSSPTTQYSLNQAKSNFPQVSASYLFEHFLSNSTLQT